jgi:Notch-like protein
MIIKVLLALVLFAAPGLTAPVVDDDNDPCSKNPCGDNGDCVKKEISRYECTCHKGFVGPLCRDSNAVYEDEIEVEVNTLNEKMEALYRDVRQGRIERAEAQIISLTAILAKLINDTDGIVKEIERLEKVKQRLEAELGILRAAREKLLKGVAHVLNKHMPAGTIPIEKILAAIECYLSSGDKTCTQGQGRVGYKQGHDSDDLPESFQRDLGYITVNLTNDLNELFARDLEKELFELYKNITILLNRISDRRGKFSDLLKKKEQLEKENAALKSKVDDHKMKHSEVLVDLLKLIEQNLNLVKPELRQLVHKEKIQQIKDEVTKVYNNVFGTTCDPNPCQNGGTCNLLLSRLEGAPLFECVCAEGFTGVLCQDAVDVPKCDPPCQHGECVNEKCECEDGWFGAACEHEKLVCPTDKVWVELTSKCPAACGGIGPCLDRYNVCICKPGTVLEHADDVFSTCIPPEDCPICEPSCLHGECVYDGTPITHLATTKCECEDGWIGAACDEEVITCDPACQHGECVKDDQEPPMTKCECEDGWFGAACDQEKTVCPSDKVWVESTSGCPAACVEETGKLCLSRYNVCICKPGTVLLLKDDVDSTCVPREECPPICVPSCLHGECVQVGFPHIMTKCECEDGWIGEACDEEVITCDPLCQHGECVRDEKEPSKTKCECEPRWTGAACDKFNCDPPCLHGKCVIDDHNLLTTKCECEGGWSGATCQKRMVTCDPPCLHGECVIDVEDRFKLKHKCECGDSWFGSDCGKAVTACAPTNPCKNGGICDVHAFVGYRCKCVNGFSGRTCQIPPSVDHCLPNPCLNGGTCANDGDDYQCHCSENFRGINCEIFNDEPKPPTFCIQQPCKNGGICVDAEVPPFSAPEKCICVNGFSGFYCEVSPECPLDKTLSLENVEGACAPGCRGSCDDRLPKQVGCKPCFVGCICKPGTLLSVKDDVNSECVLAKECDEGNHCHENPCAPDQFCTLTETGYTCVYKTLARK